MGESFKRLLCIIAGFTLMSFVCSCDLGDQNTNKDKNKDKDVNKKLVIGLVMDGLVIERWQKDRDIFISKAKELGAQVIVRNANEDIERQITQINEIMEEGIDVLVIIPYDRDDLTQCVRVAKKKGIPVIAYDRLIRNAGVDAYISFDNEQVGRLMAGVLYSKVPEGNYIIINGSRKDNNSYMFNSGFKEALEEGINSGSIYMADEVWSQDWREEVAYDTVSKAIKKGQKIDGVIGANDRLAEGAIKALSENRLANEVHVVGHDADLSACQRIVEGTQLATVYKPIKVLAEGAAELAVDMARGNNIVFYSTVDDGKYEVPFIKYKPILVTKENMEDTIIKDGFHTAEEVYRNVP